MNAFTLSGRIEADAKAFVAATKEAGAALDGLKKAETETAAAADKQNAAMDAALAKYGPLGQATKAQTQATNEQVQADTRAKVSADGHTEAEKRRQQAIGLTRMQMMTLRYTASDLVASMASGMSPLTILMQQGPQVLQAFDSPRQAISGLLSIITPLRAAMVGLPAVFVAGVAAHESYAASIRQIDVALIAHGDRLGLTRSQHLALASTIADTAAVSEREGRTAAAAMIAGSAESEAAILSLTTASRGYAVAAGKDVPEALTELAGKLRDPAKAARELAEQFNGVDEATLRNIESMQRQGDLAGAQEAYAKATAVAFADAAEKTGWWARNMEWLGNEASDLWDTMGRAASAGGVIDVAMEAYLKQHGLVRGNLDALAAGPAKFSSDFRKRVNEESTAIGALDRKYDPDGARLQMMDDEQVRLEKAIGNPELSKADRERAESTLNNLLEARADLMERIAKAGEAEGAGDARRLGERLLDHQRELDFERQIFAARAEGNDQLVMQLEAQRDVARQGFDLNTAQGQAAVDAAIAQAELKAKTDELIETQKTHAATVEDIRRKMEGLRGGYASAVAAADAWRMKALAGLDETKAGYQQFAAEIDHIHGTMLADAYEEDLRRRTDWQAGVERGLRDLQRESRDFADTAERGLTDMSASAEEGFVRMMRTGKASFTDLGDAFIEMLARMAYQKYAKGGIDSLLSMGVDFLGSLLGGGGSPSYSSAGQVRAGIWHGGGKGDAPPASANYPAALFDRAPRFHNGIGPDEIAAVIRKDEGVFTPRQMDNADNLIAATWALASRPIVAPAGAGGGAPRPNIVFQGAPQGTRTEERQREDGGWDIDVLFDQIEERMAGNVSRGRSPLNGAIEKSYGMGKSL